ncbi:MAG: ABC transporter ATP-binding protein [Mogibacterium sp.]|nr:ABC transporter ATP-binding protein [Mogibacterium sp.]
MATDEKPVVIRFTHVTKEYKLYKNDKARFKSLFSNKKNYKIKRAVDDLSFELRKGEGMALIGRNGAGKSTILKMITGVSYPTEGEIFVEGTISALLELSSGFDPEADGYENIKLKCSLMGMSDDEIKAVLPDIVEFADIGEYIEQPLRSYSSGMRARLGFAISVNCNPDILIVDEALSVGDRAFRKKCTAKVKEIMADSNVTLLFVTHALATAKDFCQKGIVLEKGKKLYEGNIDDAIEFYDSRN